MHATLRRLNGTIVLALAVGACNRGQPDRATDEPAAAAAASPAPDWLATLIAQLESQPVANPPASLTRFEYKGQTVYYLPPRCCDVPSTLYGASGAVLCSPDGGMTGRGDGRCNDFFDTRKNEKLVWRDKRSR